MAFLDEAQKLTLPLLEQTIAVTIATADDFLGRLPIRDISPAVQAEWNQELTITTNNSGSVIASDGTFTPAGNTYTLKNQSLTVVGASVNIPRPLATPAVVASELTKKAKGVARSMGKDVWHGVFKTMPT